MNQTELQPAIDYVQQHGTPVEQARLRHVLYGDSPPEDVLEVIERSQRGDGGWSPFWATDYSSLDATCYQMAIMNQLGLGRQDSLVIDGVRFLAERQHLDGSWEENPDHAEVAPIWAKPGEVAARLYVTANCAYWVAMSSFVPPAVRDAANYLAFHMSENGALPSFPQTHWLAIPVWRQHGMDGEVEKGLGYLHDLIPKQSAGNLGWMILALRQGGVAADDKVLSAAVDRLIELRDPTGHWPSDEGASNAVHVTIEAIYSLQLCGCLS